MLKLREKCKHEQVFDRLVEVLLSKSLAIGDRVPSERDLAARLDVNIATVRRAFRQLVLGGIVEKRVGSGTYLAQKLDDQTQLRPVNLILVRSIGTEVQRKLGYHFDRELADRKRRGRILYTSDDEIGELLDSCVAYRQPTIICGEVANREVLCCAPELFVCLSSMYYQEGIPTVRGDDAAGVTSLVRHLQEHGHHRIALLTNGSQVSKLEEFQAATWIAALGSDYHPSLRIRLNHIDCFEVAERSYHAMRKYLAEKNDFTALLCLQDELLLGAMAALRDTGHRIPEDISVVSIGNTPVSQFSAPPVSCIDPHLEGHLRMALDILDYNIANPEAPELFRLVIPTLMTRDSVTWNRNT